MHGVDRAGFAKGPSLAKKPRTLKVSFLSHYLFSFPLSLFSPSWGVGGTVPNLNSRKPDIRPNKDLSNLLFRPRVTSCPRPNSKNKLDFYLKKQELVMDMQAWLTTVHGVTKSQTRLSGDQDLRWNFHHTINETYHCGC